MEQWLRQESTRCRRWRRINRQYWLSFHHSLQCWLVWHLHRRKSRTGIGPVKTLFLVVLIRLPIKRSIPWSSKIGLFKDIALKKGWKTGRDGWWSAVDKLYTHNYLVWVKFAGFAILGVPGSRCEGRSCSVNALGHARSWNLVDTFPNNHDMGGIFAATKMEVTDSQIVVEKNMEEFLLEEQWWTTTRCFF